MFGEWSYLGMLGFVVVASWWLELVFRLRVLRNPRLVIKTIAIVAPAFILWDWFAIAQGHWFFHPDKVTGIIGPLGIPLEEYLFFVIIPIAAILTLEGVKKVQGWVLSKLRTDEAAR